MELTLRAGCWTKFCTQLAKVICPYSDYTMFYPPPNGQVRVLIVLSEEMQEISHTTFKYKTHSVIVPEILYLWYACSTGIRFEITHIYACLLFHCLGLCRTRLEGIQRMWIAKRQLEPLVENQRSAAFPLQTAQNMAGKNLNTKFFGLLFNP